MLGQFSLQCSAQAASRTLKSNRIVGGEDVTNRSDYAYQVSSYNSIVLPVYPFETNRLFHILYHKQSLPNSFVITRQYFSEVRVY